MTDKGNYSNTKIEAGNPCYIRVSAIAVGQVYYFEKNEGFWILNADR